MGFTSPEFSIEEGRPVELYRFRTSAGLDYRFTNAENEITDDDSLVYTPASIEREQFSQSQQRTATEMVVRLPYLDDVTDEMAQQFIDKPPEGRTTLTIKRHHLTDSGNVFVQFWQGSVISASYDENGAVELLCKGLKNIFDREGPRATWGSMCQHQLYDDLCSVDPAGFTTFNATIDSISSSGVEIALSGFGSPIPDFVGGRMIKGNGADSRLVVAQSGNVLTLQQPFRSDLVAGDTVDIEQGCNHTTGDCISKFSNIDNFGGFPYTPGLNPFNEGLDKL